ncbi:MAG TPA: alpha/beta fold hydrolase [Terriglobales bacterium]|nr:alpha/beta fold hydrolase [Terriglobales bacterium]
MTEDDNLMREDPAAADLSLWHEALVARDVVRLRTSPLFYGRGVPRGDGSGVILIPGFLLPDSYLRGIHGWLRRIGYSPYFSGIRINADCPNILIRHRLGETIERARRETGGKIHLIGHSLGGVMARALATQRPEDIASVTTLGSPFRGTVAHPSVLLVATAVRLGIRWRRGPAVLPDCYTGRCTCDFMNSLHRDPAETVYQTAIYTRSDGVVDWHYCIARDPKVNFEVSGTHIGLAWNPMVYSIVATRLAACPRSERP